MIEKNKQVRVTKDGIKIIDEELMKKVKAKNLSASMTSSFFQCPADWLMDSFILSQIEHEEPVYFKRGHIFHEMMEEFYAIPKAERNRDKLILILKTILVEKYPQVIKGDKESMLWVREAIDGYEKLVPDYMDRDVAYIPAKKGSEDKVLGLEKFVRGKLGNTKREIVGLVDFIEDMGDGKFAIRDYKTGKRINDFDADKPISDKNDFGYARQQLLYTMLLEQEGIEVSEASLEFPIAGGIVMVDVFNEKLRAQVIEDMERLDEALDKCIEENLFPFHGHFWCAWCAALHPSFKSRKKLAVNRRELVELVEWDNFE